MATLQQVLFLLTLADDWDSGQRIVEALQMLVRQPRRRRPVPVLEVPPIPRQLMLPRRAFLSPRRRRVPVQEAVGLVSAETIATYPPGSAIIVAGEEITPEVLEFLRVVRSCGGVLKGASDPDFVTIAVVE